MADAIKRYLVQRKGEQFTVDVPEAWKVTYGPLSPGSAGYNDPDKGYVLRFYETKDKQRAVFMGVTEFRDLSIPIVTYGKGAVIPNATYGDPNQGGPVVPEAQLQEHLQLKEHLKYKIINVNKAAVDDGLEF